MTVSWLVFGIGVFLVVLLIALLINADDVANHDEAVYLRFAEPRESEPPEWADADRWWESEGRK